MKVKRKEWKTVSRHDTYEEACKACPKDKPSKIRRRANGRFHVRVVAREYNLNDEGVLDTEENA